MFHPELRVQILSLEYFKDWCIYVGSYGEDCVQAFVSQENWVIVGTLEKLVGKLMWARRIELL